MKKVWLTSIILSGAMAAGLYAQQSTTSNNDKVTVQGCIQRAGSQASTAGTTGTTGSTATGSTAESGSMSGAQFVLTNVSNSNTSSSTAAGTTGTTGSTASSASPSSSEPTASQYRLDDNGQNRLASYVGQKVEVSGTVQNQEAGASSTAGSTSGTTASSSQSASSNESSPKLSVDSIRMIASSCSGL